MNKTYLLPFAILLTTSCGPSEYSQDAVSVRHDSRAQHDSGFIMDAEIDSLSRLSLSNAMSVYFGSMFNGGVDTAVTFVHPLVFKRMEAVYPPGTDVVQEFKQTLKAQSMEAASPLEVSVNLQDVSKRLEYGSQWIHVVGFNLDLSYKGEQSSTGKDRLIAISEDQSKTWKFIPANNPEVRGILAQELPDEVVTALTTGL